MRVARQGLLVRMALWLLWLPAGLAADARAQATEARAVAAEGAERRRAMVDEQIEARGVTDRAVLQAMQAVPRHRFVPDSLQRLAYADTALPIGHGQTISQPFIVAFMTEALRPDRDLKVLEIGTGSGYQAAVLAELCDEVWTIEIVPALAERARRTLSALGASGVHVRTGDGYHGWPENAPFDAIIVTAAAEAIPPPLIGQLKDGGRMLIPIGPPFGAQNLVLVTKEDGRMRTKTLLPVRFVPLVRGRED
ncbi:MAG TPA: protein-L-isoaspartate(D-aspartate) O-methyltransferase [Opitutaceae bacterium]